MLIRVCDTVFKLNLFFFFFFLLLQKGSCLYDSPSAITPGSGPALVAVATQPTV